MDMDQRYIFDLKASGIQLSAAFRTILAQYVGDDANTEILVNRLYTKTVRDIFSNMAGDIEIVHGKYSSLPDPTGIEDIMAMLHPDSKEQVRVCSELAAIEIYLTVHNRTHVSLTTRKYHFSRQFIIFVVLLTIVGAQVA